CAIDSKSYVNRHRERSMRFGGGGAGWPGHVSSDGRKPSRPTGPTLRRAISLFASYWPLIALLALAITMAGLLGLAPPLLIRAIIDDAIPNRNGSQADLLVAAIIIATLAGCLVRIGQRR